MEKYFRIRARQSGLMGEGLKKQTERGGPEEGQLGNDADYF